MGDKIGDLSLPCEGWQRCACPTADVSLGAPGDHLPYLPEEWARRWLAAGWKLRLLHLIPSTWTPSLMLFACLSGGRPPTVLW